MHPIIQEDVDRVIEGNRELLSRLDGKRVLVTGGAGFLGAYFVDMLARWNEIGAAAPVEIHALDTFITGTPKRLSHLEGNGHFHKMAQNVLDPIQDGLEFSFILHFASIASPTFYRKYPLETVDSNVRGLRNLLDYADSHKIQSMLFMSTSEIYGDPPASQIPTSEEYRGNVSCTGPRACYDESKRLGETLCTIYSNSKGVRVKIARPFNVYGPGLRIDDKRVVPDMFSGAFYKKEIILHSDGTPSRSFCYVSDALDGFVKILLSSHEGEPFNVGNDAEEVAMGSLASKVAGLFGSVRVTYRQSGEKDYLTDNPQRRCPNLGKIKRLTGYAPTIGLDEGLKRMKAWYETEIGTAPG